MKARLIGILMAITCYGEAALPPLYQSLAELQAVLQSPELSKRLTSADYIESIERSQDGFLIVTNKNTLQAHIITEPATRPGPAKFNVTFDNPKPR